MNIIIIGGGNVGYSLAEYLIASNHQITIIERNRNLCAEINSKIDVNTIYGVGTIPSVLAQADAKNAHMIIAVTPYDDTNLLCCNFAKQFGIKNRIARLKSTEYTKNTASVSLKELGVTHIIEPEIEIVHDILQYIKLPGVTESANFQSDNVYLRGYKITEDMPIANKTLFEVTKFAGVAQILIVLIIRNGKSITPTGSERIIPGDEVIAIMPSESLEMFKKLLNRQNGKLKKIIIFGDSLTAFHLAETLEPITDRIILVDPDETHGRMVASKLSKTEVLFGDCTNVEMLQEVHVNGSPFFVAASVDSEDNIMASLLAKAEGAQEVIAVTTNARHSKLFQSLGIDRVINPQKITTQNIIANIFKVPIGSLLSLKDANVQVSRFIAGKNCTIISGPLKDIKTLAQNSIIVGCVFRNDTVIIPSGSTLVKEGDEVLVICPPQKLKLAGKLFKSGFRLSVS